MTTEEKLARFSQDAILKATKQRDDELAEYEKNLDNLFTSHSKSTRHQAAARIALTREGLSRERNRRLSMQRLEAKHRYNEAEITLKDKLFDQVHGMLDSYRKKPAYTEDLIRLIETAKQQSGVEKLCIFLDKADEALVPTLAAKTGLLVQVTDEPICGGILAMPEAGNILIDLSYAAALGSIYENLKLGGNA